MHDLVRFVMDLCKYRAERSIKNVYAKFFIKQQKKKKKDRKLGNILTQPPPTKYIDESGQDSKRTDNIKPGTVLKIVS